MRTLPDLFCSPVTRLKKIIDELNTDFEPHLPAYVDKETTLFGFIYACAHGTFIRRR